MSSEESELLAGTVEALPQGRLAEQLGEGRPLRVKLGIDPTAPDIHLGHVVVLQKLRQFQDAGHQAVLIIGDYTARVGDPSGRSAERPELEPAQIDANAETFAEQAFKVLDRERTEVRRNSEWLDMESDELFGLVRRFTVSRLLERDDFEQRLVAGRPISILELVYPILQGYDSVAVDADLELGGTDQKFNLLLGRDVQTAYGRPQQSIVTTPILTGLDGQRRMSKSLGNYVGVAEEPAEMFGKLMSIPDDLMADYYLLLLGEQLTSGEHPNQAKRRLARGLVERFHDSGAAAAAEQRFDRIHVAHDLPEDIAEHAVPRESVSDSGEVHVPALIASIFGLSRSEARRLVGQGAVRIDQAPLDPAMLDLPLGRLEGRVLSVGKRRHARLSG